LTRAAYTDSEIETYDQWSRQNSDTEAPFHLNFAQERFLARQALQKLDLQIEDAVIGAIQLFDRALDLHPVQ
jgi:hypothetical protein